MELNLVKNMAQKINERFHVGFDDLFSEGVLAYLVAMQHYDLSKGSKETTWVFKTIKHRMYDICRQQAKNEITEESLEFHQDIISSMLNPEEILLMQERENTLEEKLFSLSQEAKQICKMIFESPEEFLSYSTAPTLPRYLKDNFPEAVNTPKLARGKVVKRLREFGWPWQRIWSAFGEIKNLLNEI